MINFIDHNGTHLAYEKISGQNPTIIFLPGFKSDMQGSKADALMAHCKIRNLAMLRFDYSGHGRSQGLFDDGTISGWLADTLYMIDHVVTGPLLLVGSSMGGWLALLAALARPQRVQALLLIAPAPDFTQWGIEAKLSTAEIEQLATQGFITQASDYGPEPYTITHALVTDGNHHLLLGKTVEFAGPVRIVQGQKDADVPWQTALVLQNNIASQDVALRLVKDGDHRLSRPQDIAWLCHSLDELVSTTTQNCDM